ncbi:MAG: SH3 domain-containing protein, partial [Rhodospirillaceae bacterium]|nr:SH3 domain-containing protein [Rhodospirillaceae bacterium]
MTMLRACAALAAALLVPGMAGAKELKPKFGNIDGVYYSDVSGNREACRQAIRNKIALCRQNVDFESNTKNRKYKGCLPIFRRQAQSCVVHFRHQMSKCDLSGAARITDFTGFGCEATRTVVEDGGGPDIAPLDRRMAARTRVNLRAGPGTSHRVVGSLAAGQAVQATGRAGDWLRISLQGRTAFVHG